MIGTSLSIEYLDSNRMSVAACVRRSMWADS